MPVAFHAGFSNQALRRMLAIAQTGVVNKGVKGLKDLRKFTWKKFPLFILKATLFTANHLGQISKRHPFPQAKYMWDGKSGCGGFMQSIAGR